MCGRNPYTDAAEALNGSRIESQIRHGSMGNNSESGRL
jgi:hypothetical protein